MRSRRLVARSASSLDANDEEGYKPRLDAVTIGGAQALTHPIEVKRELARGDWKYLQQYADSKTAVVREILARTGR